MAAVANPSGIRDYPAMDGGEVGMFQRGFVFR
jgi:hypothetical protein